MKKILAAVGLVVAFLGVSGEALAVVSIGAVLMLPEAVCALKEI